MRFRAPRQVCIASKPVEAKRATGHLLRVLGAGFGVAIGVGASIGSGIFRTPGDVAARLNSPLLIFVVWGLGGVYSLLCSSSASELGAMLPGAGGWYVYALRAFGQRTGFVVGCIDWINKTVATSYLSVVLGEFTVELFPALNGYAKWISATGLLLLTLLNWLGVRPGSRAQEITSLAKALALTALGIAAFTLAPHASTTSAAAPLSGDHHSFFLALIVALQSVIITYDGWYSPIYFAEEDKDPGRNLPRAMIGTVLACIAIYMLMNAAMLHVLGFNHLAATHVPAAETALAIFGSYGRRLILAISLISVLSAANATMMMTPRILFAMARDRFLPQAITRVNKGGTPATALLLSSLTSLGLVLTGTFDTLIAIAAILYVAVYVFGFVALLALRRREPGLARPYRVWFYPWTTLLVVAVSAAFLIGSVIGDPQHSLLTAILILLSYIAAVLITRRRA